MTEHHHPVARTRRIAVGVLILALVLGFGLWWALARTGADHEAGDAEAVCRPLGIEVHRVPDEALEGWSPPARAAYAQDHGLAACPWR